MAGKTQLCRGLGHIGASFCLQFKVVDIAADHFNEIDAETVKAFVGFVHITSGGQGGKNSVDGALVKPQLAGKLCHADAVLIVSQNFYYIQCPLDGLNAAVFCHKKYSFRKT